VITYSTFGYLRNIYFYFIIGFLFLSVDVFPQQVSTVAVIEPNRTQDSLKVTRLIEVFYSNTSSLDSSIIYAKEALEIANNYNFIYEKSRALNVLGNAYNNLGEFNKALAYYYEAHHWLLKNDINDVRLFSSSLNIGRMEVLLGNYTLGIDYLEKALKLAELANNKNFLCLSYINLGHVFFDLDRLDVSSEYYLKGLYFAHKMKDQTRVSGLLTDLGNVNYKRKKYETAFKYYSSAQKIKEKLDDFQGMSITLLNMGSCNHMLGETATDQNEKKERFREALQYFNKALVISKEYNLKATESLVLNNIGVLNIQIENIKEGLRFCHEAEKIAEQTGEILRKQDVYDCLYAGYKELNQPDKALIYLERFNEIKDSLFSREALKRANQLQFERELTYREAIQQAELEKERALSEIKNKQQQYKIIILIVLLGLALFIVFLLIRQRRKTIQNYREIVRKNVELMKSEAELHVFKEKEKSDEFDLAALEVKNKEQKVVIENIDEAELKESKLNISEEQSSLLLNKINILFYKEKIYLDYDLTLSSLAEKLNSNTTYVSRIINDSFGKNFSAVISEFRVKEARKMLADPKFNNLTIEGIARETGFRSMPSFNRAFKSYTGVSPSFFKHTAQEGLDKPEEVD